MSSFSTKGILVGCALAIGLGFVCYVLTNFYLMFTNPRASVDEIMLMFDSHLTGVFGRSCSFLIMLISGYIAALLSQSYKYSSAAVLAAVVSLSIMSIPVHVYSIHINFIIVTVGSLAGAFLCAKTRKNLTRPSTNAQ